MSRHRHKNPDGALGGWVDDTASVGKGAIVGEGASVGKGASVGEGASVGKGASEAQNARAIAADYRAERPTIPVVDHLDAKILCAIGDADCGDPAERGDGTLRMVDWHTCETTHCRAGWAITLAGQAGAELEALVGPAAAGGMIYRASTGRWPNFYTDDETALDDIRRCAAEDKETP